MNSTKEFPIDGSRDALWMATAVKAPETERLSSDLDCDVAIVGGGLVGLNAALSLAVEGKSVTVLEAKTLGYGASGRSGGQVNLGLNLGPQALLKTFGEEQGRRLLDVVFNTPSLVFDRISDYGIDCDSVRSGWIQGAVNSSVCAAQERMAREYEKFGCELELLDQNSVAEYTGTDLYLGGLLSPTAGSLHPLSYTRELARVALQFGAKVFTQSPVSSLQRDGALWSLKTQQGRVRCHKVLLAGNGYTDSLLSGLEQAIVPVRSILMASEPLSVELRQSVLPNHMSFVDKRRMILFFRYDRDGRLCAGYHGPMRDAFHLDDYRNLKDKVTTIFPQMKSTKWEFYWGGRIAMTKSKLPFIAEPLPGVFASMGCNGRGVGMGTVLGMNAAQYLTEQDQKSIAFPLTKPSRFMMHRFHSLGVNASIKLFEIGEYLDGLKSH